MGMRQIIRPPNPSFSKVPPSWLSAFLAVAADRPSSSNCVYTSEAYSVPLGAVGVTYHILSAHIRAHQSILITGLTWTTPPARLPMERMRKLTLSGIC